MRKIKDGSTPLHLAAMEGKVEVIPALIQAGADINTKNKDGSTPLVLVKKRHHLDAVRELEKAGAK